MVEVPDNRSPRLIGRHGDRECGATHPRWLTANPRDFVTDDEPDEHPLKPAAIRTQVLALVRFDPAPPAAESIGVAWSSDHNRLLVGNTRAQTSDRRGLIALGVTKPGGRAVLIARSFEDGREGH